MAVEKELVVKRGQHLGQDRHQRQDPDRTRLARAVQIAFSGQGWLLIQPSEGRVGGDDEHLRWRQGSGAGGVLGQVLGR